MLSVVLHFYKNFWIILHVVAWGGWLAVGAPIDEEWWGMIAPLFWLKLASYGVVWLLMQTFSRQGYLFYQNLGYSPTALFVGAFGLDMVLFFTLLTTIRWSLLLF